MWKYIVYETEDSAKSSDSYTVLLLCHLYVQCTHMYESEDLAESSVSYTIHVHIQKAYKIAWLGIWRLDWDLRFIIQRVHPKSLYDRVPVSTLHPHIRTQLPCLHPLSLICLCIAAYLYYRPHILEQCDTSICMHPWVSRLVWIILYYRIMICL